MTRLLIASIVGVAIGVVVGAALGLHAQSEIPDETAAAAAGLDPVDVQGALNALADAGLSVSPRQYLIAEGALVGPPPPAAPAPSPRERQVSVRLTFYRESGVTFGGGHPYPGSTACSWNFPLATRFRLPDGEIFVCNDRGLLGSSGWLDLWRAPATVARFGPYVTVEVLP